VAMVLDVGHRVLRDRLRERGPARPRLELGARLEERISAAGADVGPGLLGAEETPGEGPLGAVVAEDLVGLRREALLPFLVGQDELVHAPNYAAQAAKTRSQT